MELTEACVPCSSKPGFFKDENKVPLFEVDIRTGMLQNTDNGTPLVQIGGSGLSPGSLPHKDDRRHEINRVVNCQKLVFDRFLCFCPDIIFVRGNGIRPVVRDIS